HQQKLGLRIDQRGGGGPQVVVVPAASRADGVEQGVLPARRQAHVYRQELASFGRRSSSSTTRTWCGGSGAQSQNTTFTSTATAPLAKLGTMAPAVPAATRRSVI